MTTLTALIDNLGNALIDNLGQVLTFGAATPAPPEPPYNPPGTMEPPRQVISPFSVDDYDATESWFGNFRNDFRR